MLVFNVIALIAYIALFIALVCYMKEVHFIHRTKKCAHICHLCEYAMVCHGGERADDNDFNNTPDHEFLFVKRNNIK